MLIRRAFAAALLVVLVSSVAPAAAQQESGFRHDRPFGTLEEQAQLQQRWLEERLTVNLPKVMREQGVDMWVVPMREYNEDPVFRALVSATSFAARRRTIFVFFDRGEGMGVERLTLGGSSQGGIYEPYRAPRETSRPRLTSEKVRSSMM